MAFSTWTLKPGSTTTTTTFPPTEVKADPTFSGVPWFIPDTAQSSVVRSFKFREVEEGETLIVVTTHSGDEYSYQVPTADARDFYADLEDGESPGRTWNVLRDYFKNLPEPVPPVEMATVSISGPADQIALIAASAEAQGLTIF